MEKILTPRQMTAADLAAVESGIASSDLMDRAGRGVGRAVLRAVGGAYGRRVTVVCGKGNNGGDGLVAATWLARRGVLCNVVMMSDPAELTGDALDAYSRCTGPLVWQYDRGRLAAELARSDLAVDALLGTGFAGALREPIFSAVAALNAGAAPVLSVDIPSGVNGQTGAVDGEAVRAVRTVTLAALKGGLVLQPGAQYAGEVEVVDIGIPDPMMQTRLYLAGPEDLAAALPARPVTAHKRSTGKVLVVGGSAGMSGAVALAASGALRAGAGLVRMAVPGSIRSLLAPLVVEALTAAMPETHQGTFSAGAVAPVVKLASEMQVVALGPGIGKDTETMEFAQRVVSEVECPVVLDADGLSAFAANLQGLRSRVHPTVLTPHSGELARLLDCEVSEVEADRIVAARQAAERSGAVVLLKGFRTVVARPDGHTVMVDAGGPVLATAGTGDVLTGVVAALTPGADPFTAAWAGACLHGMAGETLAEWMGERGVVAGDLLKALPLVARQVIA